MNIGDPSAICANRIAEYLLSKDLDVITLTETRVDSDAAALIKLLSAAAHSANCLTALSTGKRGTALLDRLHTS